MASLGGKRLAQVLLHLEPGRAPSPESPDPALSIRPPPDRVKGATRRYAMTLRATLDPATPAGSCAPLWIRRLSLPDRTPPAWLRNG